MLLSAGTYLATTESPLSSRVGGGEAPIFSSGVLGREDVPELDGQDSSVSSEKLGPVSTACVTSEKLDFWDLNALGGYNKGEDRRKS